MATEWISPTWRMPNDKNQSKFENYSLDFATSTVTTTATMTFHITIVNMGIVLRDTSEGKSQKMMYTYTSA